MQTAPPACKNIRSLFCRPVAGEVGFRLRGSNWHSQRGVVVTLRQVDLQVGGESVGREPIRTSRGPMRPCRQSENRD